VENVNVLGVVDGGRGLLVGSQGSDAANRSAYDELIVELAESLMWYVGNECQTADGEALESCGYPGHARALRLLARVGTVEIVSDEDDDVTARWR